jgi:hypothetical protein
MNLYLDEESTHIIHYVTRKYAPKNSQERQKNHDGHGLVDARKKLRVGVGWGQDLGRDPKDVPAVTGKLL